MTATNQDPVREWLGAYLDGELSADRRAWVEGHLAACAACRGELAELRALSALLHADPEPVFTAARSALPLAALPARPVEREDFLYRPGALRWVPLALFALWAFVQASVTAASAVMLGQAFFPLLGLPDISDRVALPSGLPDWLSGALRLGDLPGSLETLIATPALLLLMVELGAAVVIGVLFLSWLAGLYTHRRSALLLTRG